MIKVILTGNIATGKSTLGEKIAERLSFPLEGIDVIRHAVCSEVRWDADRFQDRKHFHNTRNLIARNRFYELMQDEYEAVYEASGYSKGFVNALDAIRCPVIHFHLTCKIDEVLHRIEKRFKSGYRQPPVPDWWAEGLSPLDSLKRSAQFMCKQPYPKGSGDHYEFHLLSSGTLPPNKLLKKAMELINAFGEKHLEWEDDYEPNDDYDGYESEMYDY